MSNKNRVLHFIKHDRTLTGARNLYNSLPNKSLSFLASINRMRPTETNLKHVCYHLCKKVGLEERQMLALWQHRVTPAPSEKEEEPEVEKAKQSERQILVQRILDFDAEKAKWLDIQSLAGDITEETGRKPEGRSKEDLLAFIGLIKETVVEEIANEIPIQVKQSIKLREQFPFLREKDCPEVLKLLVNDLITAYENYTAGRKRLFESLTQKEEAILARDIVDNFIENKQAFAELEHYGKTGKILGEHPIFEEIKIKEALQELSADELSKKAGALRKNISTNKKKAEEADDEEKKAEYLKKVEDYTWQEAYVKELLKKK